MTNLGEVLDQLVAEYPHFKFVAKPYYYAFDEDTFHEVSLDYGGALINLTSKSYYGEGSGWYYTGITFCGLVGINSEEIWFGKDVRKFEYRKPVGEILSNQINVYLKERANMKYDAQYNKDKALVEKLRKLLSKKA